MSQKKTLKNLQTGVSMELTAMHQYQLHASVLDDWGMNRLASKMREEMQEELGHSDEFIARIMFLKGQPELTLQKTPVRAESLKAMFELDLADEREALSFYVAASKQAADENDLGTRMLFERIAIDEEGHIGWLELQLDLLNRIGEPAYISKYISVAEDSDPPA
jgi:bacterioferritin